MDYVDLIMGGGNVGCGLDRHGAVNILYQLRHPLASIQQGADSVRLRVGVVHEPVR